MDEIVIKIVGPEGSGFPAARIPKQTKVGKITDALVAKLNLATIRNSKEIRYGLYWTEQRSFLKPDVTFGEQGVYDNALLKLLEEDAAPPPPTPPPPPPTAPPAKTRTVENSYVKLYVKVNFVMLAEAEEFPLTATASDIFAVIRKKHPMRSQDGRSLETAYEIKVDELGRKLNPNDTLQSLGVRNQWTLLIFSDGLAGAGHCRTKGGL